MTTTTTAPLANLYHHIINPRQAHDPDDIFGLAQSIAAVGLLQNLSAFIDPAQDGFGIVAGGRRLAALAILAAQPDDFPDALPIDFEAIPLITTTDATLARSWAGAEAATQRPLHPADEIRAYGAMQAENHTPTAIARAFGCTVAHVNRRLKLADLPHQTLMALREDKITLDAAAALTLCTTSDQHTAMLEEAQRGYSIGNLKYTILQGRVKGDDRRAKFVGAELYTMEGGTVETDLFTEQTIFADEVLLDRLFQEKVTTAAERVKEDHGYATVIPIFSPHVSWSHTENLTRLQRVKIELPEADAEELEKLQDTDGDDLTDDQYDRIEELEERQRGIYTDEDIANGTAFIYVAHDGTLKTEGPYLTRQGTNAAGGDSSAGTIAAKPPITQGGMDDLRRLQLLALQTKIMSKPDLILDLLAFQITHDTASYSAAFNITISDQHNTPSNTEEVRIDARLSSTDPTPITTSPSEAFNAFKDQGKSHRNKSLALALARTLNQPWASPINADLFDLLGASVRDVWTPTADNHFKACSVPTLDATWRELVCADADYPTDEMERFAKLKKGEKVKELGKLFSNAAFQEALGLNRTQTAAIDAWVPTMLREDEK